MFPAGFPRARRPFPRSRRRNSPAPVEALEVRTLPALAIPTVTPLVTNTTSPVITGTWDQTAATTLKVTLNGVTHTLGTSSALQSESGVWTLTPGSLSPATYDVVIHTENAVESADDTTSNELVIDVTPPSVPVVNVLVTNDATPLIGGTIDVSAVVLTVTVDGVTYIRSAGEPRLTSDAGGRWWLDLSAETPLSEGRHQVAVHTVDAAGNSSDDATADEVTIDLTPPGIPTLVSQVTNDATPTFSGTWDATASDLQVTVHGKTYSKNAGVVRVATSGSSWTLNLDGTSPLPDGTLPIRVRAVDLAGNIRDDVTDNELFLDATPPAVPTVDLAVTANRTPTLTGTWDSAGASLLRVTANAIAYTLGAGETRLIASGNQWSLNLSGTTPLADGAYDVLVFTADAVGNTRTDATTAELTIDTVAPCIPTVARLSTSSVTPTLTGTWDPQTTDQLEVTVNGATFVLYDGRLSIDEVTWSLDLTGTGNLAEGTYDVRVRALDTAGNVSQDATTGELTIATVRFGDVAAVLNGKTLTLTGAAGFTCDFDVQITSGGVTLTGHRGTTFGGSASKTLAKVSGLVVQLADGSDRVRVLGTVKSTQISLGDGANELVLESFHGKSVGVSTAGPLSLTATDSVFGSLSLSGGGGADSVELFRSTFKTTGLQLGSGADVVRIQDAIFSGNLALASSGNGSRLEVEAAGANGTGTVFKKTVEVRLGPGALLNLSPAGTSDQTSFLKAVTLSASGPGTLTRNRVTFKSPPTLTNFA